jgi:hypothetical protein
MTGVNLHEEGSSLVHHFVGNVISQCLEVVLDRDLALGRKLLDFLGSLVFPVLDILICPYT